MTEKLPPLSTQIAPPSQIAPPAVPPGSAQDVVHKSEPVEEEPYTIKCICRFSDDDGNTIYCETCETWQHIECYYPNNVEDAYGKDFAHFCADCKPRPLDRQQAIERQRSRLSNLPIVETAAAIDKKAKRPPSKSHKKKPKPTDIQVVTQPATDATKQASSHEQPPAKKSKNSHKASQSISSQGPKRSPPFAPGRAAVGQGHPPSPAHTPPDLPQDFELHGYSAGFLSLHGQGDVTTVQTNSYASINISNTISLWLREPTKLRQETGQEFDDVFRPLPSNIDSIKRPPHLETKKMVLSPDTIVRWQYLTMPVAVEKDVPLIELNGLIGFQKDYSADKGNRWDEFTTPLPFVFFHEMLPLYIDTRREGSRARYVRRSCRPNAVLDTFLSGSAEYHFWLVSDRHIAANEQITIGWDFRLPTKQKARFLHLLGLDDEEHGSHGQQQDIEEAEYQSLAIWLHLILSEYGGCACDLENNCAFRRFHRNYIAKSQARSTTKKKSRKPKNATISPTSTGHATNSRAASEGRMDDGPDGDAMSVSSRSKPPSRDMTPAQTTPAPRQGSFDTLGILTEPTDRDKRKVAMVEDSFRRMEQHPGPPRKKKRVSDGTTSSSTSTSKPPKAGKAAPGQPNGVQYVDAGTSRSKSGSPSSAVSPGAVNPFKHPASRHGSAPLVSRHASIAPRGNYCDASVQTDPVEGEWYTEAGQTPVPRRKFKSLSKMLLENRHRVRQEEEEHRRKRESTGSARSVQSASSDAMLIDSIAPTATDAKPLAPPPPLAATTSSTAETRPIVPPTGPGAAVDTPMPDAPATPVVGRPPPPPVLVTEPSPGATAAAKNKSPELRVLMPPVPAFNGGVVSAVSSATTPVSATSVVQSPFSTNNLTSPFPLGATNGVSAANPSPVKKKLSLSDYTKSRKAAASRPSIGTSLKASTTNPDDPKSATSVEGPAISGESPSAEKGADSHAVPAASEATVNGS